MAMASRILLLVSLLLTASCIESTNPLSDPAKSIPDTHLVGAWRAKSENGDLVYVHFGHPQGKLGEHFLYTMQLNHDKDRGLSTKGTEWRLVFISKVGKQTFFNTVIMTPEAINKVESTGWKPGPDTKFDLFRYELSGNTMKVLVPEQEVIRKAITEKRLRGEDQKLGGVKITDSSENLAKFMEREAKNLFPASKVPLVFTRVR